MSSLVQRGQSVFCGEGERGSEVELEGFPAVQKMYAASSVRETETAEVWREPVTRRRP